MVNRFSSLIMVGAALLMDNTMYRNSIIYILTPCSLVYHIARADSQDDIYAKIDNFGVIFVNLTTFSNSHRTCFFYSLLCCPFSNIKSLIHLGVYMRTCYLIYQQPLEYVQFIFAISTILKLTGLIGFYKDGYFNHKTHLLWHTGVATYLWTGSQVYNTTNLVK
ncbi:MAG: hypothetical protein CMM25_02885 [Rhodospirillaceae bacterium]|nr:hypothetical protein [Rhodospirillaceae bacterium]